MDKASLCGARALKMNLRKQGAPQCRFLALAPVPGLQRTLTCRARASCFWRYALVREAPTSGQMPAVVADMVARRSLGRGLVATS